MGDVCGPDLGVGVEGGPGRGDEQPPGLADVDVVADAGGRDSSPVA
jgi:hypothetical protein